MNGIKCDGRNRIAAGPPLQHHHIVKSRVCIIYNTGIRRGKGFYRAKQKQITGKFNRVYVYGAYGSPRLCVYRRVYLGYRGRTHITLYTDTIDLVDCTNYIC